MSGFQLQRLGLIMEPEPGNPLEVEGTLNPAAVRAPLSVAGTSADAGRSRRPAGSKGVTSHVTSREQACQNNFDRKSEQRLLASTIYSNTFVSLTFWMCVSSPHSSTRVCDGCAAGRLGRRHFVCC
jgi:hypothetical protein